MKIQRWIAVVCILALAFTACGKEEKSEVASGNNAIEQAKQNKGYKETEIELPQEAGANTILNTFMAEDGTPAFFAADTSGGENQDVTDLSFKYKKLTLNSENGWDSTDVEWSDALNDVVNAFPAGGIIIGEDGNEYMVMGQYTGDTSAEDINEQEVKLSLYCIKGEEVEKVKCDGLSRKEDGETLFVNAIYIGQDETAVFMYNNGKCVLYDLVTGEEKLEYSQRFTSYVSVYQDCLFGANEAKDGIDVVDKMTGELLSTIPAEIGSGNAVVGTNVNNDLFYVVEKGIYRISDDMKSSELVVDGKVFSEFGMSTETSFGNVWEKDGTFYVFYNRGKTAGSMLDYMKLYSYQQN